MKKYNLLIIGKLPLPIGGVTIHVQRLTEWLDKIGYNYIFYDLRTFNIRSFANGIREAKYAHIHCSSPALKVIFTILCILFKTKSIVTFHGNLGVYSFFKNQLDFLSLRLSSYPIVLNEGSYIQGRKYNARVLRQEAYRPALNVPEDLKSDSLNAIETLRKESSFVVCTNAFNWLIDNNNKEVYSITKLVSFFTAYPAWGLIISDPSGNCKAHLGKEPRNILFVDYPHTFINILRLSDCFVRYTTTDGDSLSIHEALDNNIPVIATDVVSRPEGTVIVKIDDYNMLEQALLDISERPATKSSYSQNSRYPDIIQFYINLK